MLICLILLFLPIFHRLHNIFKLFINVLVKPGIQQGAAKAPFLADFGSRNFAILCPGIDGLGFHLQVFRYLFYGHDIIHAPQSYIRMK